ANDIITHLDGEPVQGLTLNQAVEKMRGPENSKIKLKIMRKGQHKPIEVSITRARIQVRSVRSRLEGDDVGFIRITQFNEQTTEGLKKAITDLSTQAGDKLKSFIIDLRNNPGGLLDQAISVSDAFLEKGEIVSTRGRNAEETQRFNARAGDITKNKPVIVLINGGSASASEIVAGALQDHRRATAIRTRPFGKGPAATISPLGSGNGALRLTTARYFTPSGRSIQAKGISPDIEVLQDVPEELKARTDTRGEASLRGHLKAEGDEQTGSQSYIPPDPKDDKALHTALDLIRGIQKNSAYPPNPKTAVPNYRGKDLAPNTGRPRAAPLHSRTATLSIRAATPAIPAGSARRARMWNAPERNRCRLSSLCLTAPASPWRSSTAKAVSSSAAASTGPSMSTTLTPGSYRKAASIAARTRGLRRCASSTRKPTSARSKSSARSRTSSVTTSRARSSATLGAASTAGSARDGMPC